MAYTNVHDAVAWGGLQDVKSIINASNINQIGCYKHGLFPQTPLHVAVAQRDIEKIQLLIELGADVNARCDAYGTPLDVAVNNNYRDVARLLLQHGAQITATQECLQSV